MLPSHHSGESIMTRILRSVERAVCMSAAMPHNNNGSSPDLVQMAFIQPGLGPANCEQSQKWLILG